MTDKPYIEFFAFKARRFCRWFDAVSGTGAGTHSIEVRGQIHPAVWNAGDSWRLDDKSLVVIVREVVP